MKEQVLELLNNNYQKSDSLVGLIGAVVVHFNESGVRIIEHLDVENTIREWQSKPTGQFVMLWGPKKAKNTDGTDSDFLSLTIVKNDDKLDITGYEYTSMPGGVEQWSWVGEVK